MPEVPISIECLRVLGKDYLAQGETLLHDLSAADRARVEAYALGFCDGEQSFGYDAQSLWGPRDVEAFLPAQSSGPILPPMPQDMSVAWVRGFALMFCALVVLVIGLSFAGVENSANDLATARAMDPVEVRR